MCPKAVIIIIDMRSTKVGIEGFFLVISQERLLCRRGLKAYNPCDIPG
jgi:hypothetical protein